MSQPGAVPRRWPGSTIVCIASGPSLTLGDVEACAGSAVLTVNDGYRFAPWADVLFSADVKWWHRTPDACARSGVKVSMPPIEHHIPGLLILGIDKQHALSDDPRRDGTSNRSPRAALRSYLC